MESIETLTRSTQVDLKMLIRKFVWLRETPDVIYQRINDLFDSIMNQPGSSSRNDDK